MNPYVTTVEEFRELATPDKALKDLSDIKLQYHLDVAAAEVSAAWGAHRTLPISPSSDDFMVAKEAVIIMASYRALLKRGTTPDSEDNPLYRRYMEIVGEAGLLDRLRTGTASGSTDGGDDDSVISKRPLVATINMSRGIREFDDYGKEYV